MGTRRKAGDKGARIVSLTRARRSKYVCRGQIRKWGYRCFSAVGTTCMCMLKDVDWRIHPSNWAGSGDCLQFAQLGAFRFRPSIFFHFDKCPSIICFVEPKIALLRSTAEISCFLSLLYDPFFSFLSSLTVGGGMPPKFLLPHGQVGCLVKTQKTLEQSDS